MNSHQEPNRLAAGVLALLVHAAFFSLLYFGFSWQIEPPAAMSVELWQSLPETQPIPAPAPAPAPPVEVAPKAKVVETVKPDIVVPDKKLSKKPEPKPEVKPQPKPVEKPKSEVKKPAAPAQPSAAELQAARDKAAQDAAIGRVMDEYMAKIQSKIKRNIVLPPDVAPDARAEFQVTLLPGGRVLSALKSKSSGNAAYDNAVERAILKSDPLPLPPDAGMFSRFRELKLGFKPVE